MIQKPRGTEDLYAKKAAAFLALQIIIQNHMYLYNFEKIETPIFEFKELFSMSVGENTDIVNKEMFIFNDKKGREFVLRPEATAATARAVIEHKLYVQENLPLKLFYYGPMFRYERPQAGRQRQFTQFGIEVFGAKDINLDAEVVILATSLLETLGLKKYEVHLNYLVSGHDKEKYLVKLNKYLKDLSLCDDCQIRIKKNPLRILDCKIDNIKFENAPKMLDFLSNVELAYYDQLKKILTKLGIKIVQNDLLVRGLDYYTGYVFEIISTDEKTAAQSTLFGGGRYDKLVNNIGGVNLPAVGFGMGVERLLIALDNAKIDIVNEKQLDVYYVALSEKARFFGNSILLMMRSSNITCDMDYLNKSFKSQLKLAERNKAKFIIIVGDKELQKNKVILKNQQTREELELEFDQIISYLKEEYV
ncbi:histidine--tRNA ligase [Spiroplasma endosymbiont of Labia minor]|uniref:histidine--tRNA ligase n=1 Tax=Spiroplasma endosymbiont of Labia minor TaxID=3066305 RepID=UPI0030D4D602